MRRMWIFAVALLALSQAQPLHAESNTWFGFQVGISGGNPPPPQVVFRAEPRTVFVNDVYVVDDERCDDDVFRSDGVWWRLHGGYWFRSATWRGPWLVVDVRRVPERVLVVPARHWKHHPRGGRTVIVVRDGDHDRGRHRGHGHGHGHDHDDDD